MKHVTCVGAALLSLLVACGSADFSGSSTTGRRSKASQSGGGGSLTGSGSGGSTSNGSSGLGSDGGLDVGEIDGSDGGSAEGGSGLGSSSGSASQGDGSDGTITGDRAKLSIKGLRQDDDDVTLTIVTDDGKTATLTWPKEGEQVDLEGMCSKPKVVLKISTVRDGETYLPSNPQCFVGKTMYARSVAIGFEDDCNSLDYNRVDEEIALFSCPGSAVAVLALRLDPAIDMDEWID